MSRYSIKFPFRVRIHGGEFDESARAIHREDGLKTIQAESGIVLESTIERKQMSTKTTFKRIALVTVAALSFGVLATAPSNAAAAGGALAVTQTLSESTTTVAAGTAAKVTLTTAGYFTASDTVSSTVSFSNFSGVTAAAGVTQAIGTLPVFAAVDTETAYTGGSAGGSSQTVANPAQSVDVGLAGGVAKFVSTRTGLSVTLDYPGTYVYTIQNLNKLNSTATSTDGSATKLTWTVVVTAPTITGSTSVIGVTTTAGVNTGTLSTTTDALPAVLTAPATISASGVAVARIDVRQWSDAAKATEVDGKFSKSVVVAVSGAGSLSADNSASRGASVITAAGTASTAVAGYQDYFLHADGRTGKATITVTVDGVLASTKTFLFHGALAAYSVEADLDNIGKGETVAHAVTGLDASQNIATRGTIYAVSSDKLVATVAVNAAGDGFDVTGVAVGTATITVMNKATAADATIKKDVVVTVLPVTAPTLSWSFDKDTYEPGEKMTLTIKATGIADAAAGVRQIFGTAPSTNFTPSGVLPTWQTAPALVSGVKTITLYAPATSGKFTVSATIGQAIDSEKAKKTAADAADLASVPSLPAGTSYVATKVELSATIQNPALTAAQEATDAANEATDAGNNAKDAADQAIEAADAATIAAQDAAAAAEAAGEMAVEAAEAAGAIAQDALDAANAATDAALSAAEAADAATAAATEAKESADAATAAVAELSAEVAKLMAALTTKVTTLSNLVAKIAKKVKA